jgi:DNA-binding response OmpR family regulator
MTSEGGVLIVEDRSIIASKVRRELERSGFPIAGMVANVMDAAWLAETLTLKAAVLDVDLRGEPVYPVAETLRRRGVPFLFLTGFDHHAISPAWQHVLLVEKPFEGVTLTKALAAAIAGERASPVKTRSTTPAIRTAWDRVRHTRDLVTEQRAWAEQCSFSPSVR